MGSGSPAQATDCAGPASVRLGRLSMIRQDSPPGPLHCPVQPSGVNFQIVLRTAAYPPHGHEDISAPFRNKTPNDSPYQPHLSARTSAMARHRRQARKRLRMEASYRRSSIGKTVPRRMLSVDLAGRTFGVLVPLAFAAVCMLGVLVPYSTLRRLPPRRAGSTCSSPQPPRLHLRLPPASRLRRIRPSPPPPRPRLVPRLKGIAAPLRRIDST